MSATSGWSCCAAPGCPSRPGRISTRCEPGSSRATRSGWSDARRWRALLDAVDGCPAPVVAGVHGNVLGGACGLLACCDVVVAAPGTRFAFSEVKVGIVPAVVSPFVVARIGSGHARALFVTGERFDADRALRIGLITEIATDLDAGVERVVAEVLAGGARGRANREADRTRAAGGRRAGRATGGSTRE